MCVITEHTKTVATVTRYDVSRTYFIFKHVRDPRRRVVSVKAHSNIAPSSGATYKVPAAHKLKE